MLTMLIVWMSGAVTAQSVTAQDSVIVFAVDRLAAALTASNQFILSSLYSAERAGIAVNDTDAIFAAVRTSRRLAEPAWHAAMAREFARRTSFVTQSGIVQCQQQNETNSTTFSASAFAGASVFLESDMFIDENCNGLFENGTDRSLPSLLTGTSINVSTFQLLEVVQSTSDLRLKRFITLVPSLTNSSSQVSTPLFFQPGMSALFLPIMAAFQHPDFGSDGVNINAAQQVGEALYGGAGGVEAPISFIQGFGERCTSGASAMRFNSAPIDNRFALSTNSMSGNFPPGSVFGQCVGGATGAAVAANSSTNLIGGVFFIDANLDGIRQPRELTTTIPGINPVAILRNGARFLLSQDANGRFLAALNSGTGGIGVNVTPLAVSSQPAAAIISAELFQTRGVLKDANGNFNASSICGNVIPQMTVTSHRTDSGSQARTDQAFFLNQAIADKQQSSTSVGRTPDPEFRVPNLNVGFACVRSGLRASIGVKTFCDTATLSASQATIVDTFQVTIFGRIPEFQTWATAVTARAVRNAPIDASSLFDVLKHGVNTTFGTALTGTLRNATNSTINVSTAVIAQSEPTGLLVDFQVQLLADRDVPLSTQFVFNVSLVTNYARPEFNLACSGVPGEEIVSEFILTDYSDKLLMVIGNFGGICRHTQPTECIGGDQPTPNITSPTPLPPGSTLGPGPDGTLPIVLIFAGLAIIIVISMVVISSQ